MKRALDYVSRTKVINKRKNRLEFDDDRGYKG